VYFVTQWFFGNEVLEKLAKLGVVAIGENFYGQGGPAVWKGLGTSAGLFKN
jgi:hypothetical protein